MTFLESKIFDYAEIEPLTSYIPPRKQAVKRHYGSHQYFTKRAWNVIQAYIERFTQPNDVVCDPYGGSGVTVIEALVLNRTGIYVDISEWAGFLAEQVAIAPIDIQALGDAFHRIEAACSEKINKWCRLSDEDVAAIPISRWFPKDYPLPKNADVPFVHNLFTARTSPSLSSMTNAAL